MIRRSVLFLFPLIALLFSCADCTGRAAIASPREYAVVSNSQDSSLSVIDLSRLKVVATIPTGKEPVALATHASDVYVVNRAAGTDRKSTRLNSSHIQKSRMPSSA